MREIQRGREERGREIGDGSVIRQIFLTERSIWDGY